MEYNQKQSNGFFEAVESLKKYRRADLIDEKGNIIKFFPSKVDPLSSEITSLL
jgi:hypothetical protein